MLPVVVVRQITQAHLSVRRRDAVVLRHGDAAGRKLLGF